MKVEIVYTEEEKRMIERCENAIEMIWVSYIENLIASHAGIIQPSYEEIQKMKMDFEENATVKALREELCEIHMTNASGYIVKAENVEDEEKLKALLKRTEN